MYSKKEEDFLIDALISLGDYNYHGRSCALYWLWMINLTDGDELMKEWD